MSSSSARPLEPTLLATHPELGHLALLAHQLEVLTAVLTLVHSGSRQPEALTHHARGMVRVIRILQLQLDTYKELLLIPPGGTPHGRA